MAEDCTMLDQLLEKSAGRHAARIAAVEPGVRTIRYDELNRIANRIGELLRTKGVIRGDRIGIQVPKSITALASIFGVLKAGGVYVPVDPTGPQSRNSFIFTNCAVKFVITRNVDFAGTESSEIPRLPLGNIDPLLSGHFLVHGPASGKPEVVDVPDGLAYILYTSGSTGLPKGVMLTHANALAFIDWCSSKFQPTEHDNCSSHAPFYFDLSILDIYLSIKQGSRLVLIAEDVGRNPKELAGLISRERISIWYSTPTILKLLMGIKGVEQYDFSRLRAVLFAGEVFPTKYLRQLMAVWTTARFYNLYGPTETNVCTFYELPENILPELLNSVPIGKVCSGASVKVVGECGGEVRRGNKGELYVAGPSVTCGYWNLPERNATSFFKDADGVRWYKTGDIVRENDSGEYEYVGRRDRMIKRRGYRVELGEIEAALHRHDSIAEAAVVATPDAADGMCVTAFIDWIGKEPASIIALKRFCVENLPAYMIPDRFSLQPSLPKTPTEKIDYQRLKELV